MKIELEPGDVQAALGKAVVDGMQEAAGSYAVKDAVRAATARAIEDAGLLVRVTEQALASVQAQVEPLAEEVARSVVPALQESLREVALAQAVGIVCAVQERLHGYMDEAARKALWREVEANLRAKIGAAS
jgi:CRP-like cAMP-binding protein